MINKDKYRKVLNRVILLVLLLVSSSRTYAQNADINYSISISTDRSFYVVGETVELKVTIPELFYPEKLTRSFIYCDMIGQDGQIQSYLKLMLKNGQGESQMIIPSSLKSGYYIIKAYTREMRSNPANYGFSTIKVVNVEDKALLGFTDNSILKLDIDSLENYENGNFVISGLNRQISKRTKVSFDIEIDTNNIRMPSLSISVVPKTTFVHNKLNAKLLTNPEINSKFVYTENKGFSISGTVIQKDTSIAMLRKRIFVSIVGTKDVFTTMSDSTGKFHVSLPIIYGEHEVYISTDTIDKNAIILIDKDYDLQSNYWLNKEFRLNASEKKLALMLAQNIAVYMIFNNDTLVRESIIAKKPFYGSPDETTVIMDFIDLPRLHMYFTELPSSVHLYKKQKKYKARIFDSNSIPLLQNPLIMVDYVAVNDLDRVLKLNPKLINRIEVVNSYYQKGDLSFGGIINFISNNGDFGGLEFKKSSLVINYSFLTAYNPIQPIKDNNSPDARTTLYWNPKPDVVGNKMSIDFYTSDVEGDFEVIIQAIDKAGKNTVFKKAFKVEEN